MLEATLLGEPRAPRGALSVYAVLPRHAPLATSTRTLAGRRTLLLGLSLGDREVWSEACPLPGFGPPGAEAHADDAERAAGALLGFDPEALLEAAASGAPLPALSSHLEALSSPSARHALLTGAVGLAAQARGVSVAQLLDPGASEEPERRIAPSAVLDPLEPGTNAHLEALRRAGIGTVKLKLPREVDALLDALARLAGPLAGLSLRLDANAALDVDSAARLLEGLPRALAQTRGAPARLEWLEDPTPDPGDWATLAARAPLAVDEPLLAPGAAGVWDRWPVVAFILKPMALGGFDRALELARLARASGRLAVISHYFDGPLALRAAIELAHVAQSPEAAAGLGWHAALAPWRAGLALGRDGESLLSLPDPVAECGWPLEPSR